MTHGDDYTLIKKFVDIYLWSIIYYIDHWKFFFNSSL